MDELIDAIIADIYKKENVRGHLKPDQIALSQQHAREYLERTLTEARGRIERHLRAVEVIHADQAHCAVRELCSGESEITELRDPSKEIVRIIYWPKVGG